MTEREARRLLDAILGPPRPLRHYLRVDWIGQGPDGVKWELVCTDTQSARQFLVKSPSDVLAYLDQPSPPRAGETSHNSRQRLLF